MDIRSVNNEKEEIYPEVELLNRACLDLVSQIEELTRENARLKGLIEEGNASEVRSGPSVST